MFVAQQRFIVSRKGDKISFCSTASWFEGIAYERNNSLQFKTNEYYHRRIWQRQNMRLQKGPESARNDLRGHPQKQNSNDALLHSA